MKRILSSLVISGAAMGVSGAAFDVFAAPAAPAPARALATEIAKGSIESVDLEKSVFVLIVAEDESAGEKRLSITVNDRTAFTLDGKPSSKEEALKAGRDAVAVHEEMIALKVDVTTPKPR